jgi:hypothetical protein
MFVEFLIWLTVLTLITIAATLIVMKLEARTPAQPCNDPNEIQSQEWKVKQ